MENQKQTNGLGTAGFVLALISLFFCWLPLVNGILWLIGLTFSLIGVFRQPKGLAITGLVLSVIVLFIMIFLLTVVLQTM